MKHCICFLLLLLSACSTRYNKQLEQVLIFAGQNRTELEKVLNHYEHEPLKLEAAKFLIANMQDKYFYDASELDGIKEVVKDAIAETGYLNKEQRAKWEHFSFKRLPKIYDAKVITAEYLIENIELAFESWQKYEWGKYCSFDDFCEYILPYRIADEPLEHWRRDYKERFIPVLDSLYRGTDIVAAADSIQHYLCKLDFYYNKDFNLPHFGGAFLLKYRIGTCRENADFMVYLFRTLGIPVAIDRYIYSPDCRLGHTWNVMRDTTGLFIPIELRDTGITRGRTDGRLKGKVYRYCFNRQEEPTFGGDYYSRDVTLDYFPPNSVVIPCVSDGNRDGLISVFSFENWIPIGKYVARHGKAYVDNVEKGVILQPLIVTDNRLVESGYPFMIDEDSVRTFVPNLQKKGRVRLTRKYPVTKNLRKHLYRMNGAHFEGSNDIGFRQSDLLACIQDSSLELKRYLPIDNEKKYRYVKFVSPPAAYLHTAEIALCADSTFRDNLDFNIEQYTAPMHGSEERDIMNAFDNNRVTFYLSGEKDASYVMDLGKPTKLGGIVFVPRNDDNFVSIGDTYELLYQNGPAGWISLGHKVAKDDFVEFENVPANALLRLHDCTKGVEEQVFWWAGNKQIFLGHLR